MTQRGSEIGHLYVCPYQPLDLSWGQLVEQSPSGEATVVIVVALPELGFITALSEFLKTVLAQGLEQPISGGRTAAVDDQHRLPYQTCERIQDVVGGEAIPGAHLLSGGEVKGASEHRDPLPE